MQRDLEVNRYCMLIHGISEGKDSSGRSDRGQRHASHAWVAIPDRANRFEHVSLVSQWLAHAHKRYLKIGMANPATHFLVDDHRNLHQDLVSREVPMEPSGCSATEWTACRATELSRHACD